MSALPERRYSLEEYLELDRNSDERFEYWNGEVFSMGGVSEDHAEIESDLMVFLKPKAVAGGCRVFPANMRIKVPTFPPYRYGDLSALCGKAKFEKIDGVDVLTNPALIIEVLSYSTEAHDRGDKFTHYKSILNFQEYLLVAQHRAHVTQLLKQSDGTWLHLEFNDLNDVVKLRTLDCDLPLREIYQNVSFDPNSGYPRLVRE